MLSEEDIKTAITKKFNFLADKVKVVRPRRISVEVEQDQFFGVLEYFITELKFSRLCTITGLDEGERLSVIYHLAQDQSIIMNLKMSVPKMRPAIKSVISYFPGAECYEREIVDLLGFQVEGLPVGSRYPLTDDWPKNEFPLRKDWKGVTWD